MRLRNVGESGLRVSEIGLGCNNFGGRIDREQTIRVVEEALDSGITLFDTADIYGNRGGSESLLGDVLGPRRKDVVLATKFAMAMNDSGTQAGGSRRYIMDAVEASLKRLRTDWIDLYQLHRPDPLTPMDETLAALDTLVCQGKVRYIGCSNMPAWQFADAIWTARSNRFAPFVSIQDEYNLLNREAEWEKLPAARHFGAGLLPYYPLAGGFLTGKYDRDSPIPHGLRLSISPTLANRYAVEANWDILERLQRFCQDRGRTLQMLAIAWLLAQRPVSSVIAGASSADQVAANVRAAEWRLSDDEREAVDAILAAGRTPS